VIAHGVRMDLSSGNEIAVGIADGLVVDEVAVVVSQCMGMLL
jgi:hypothetical protein